jgi:hypothetical protein
MVSQLPGLGFPIRTSPGHRLLASIRGLSQLATSFFAYLRQGIHTHALSSLTIKSTLPSESSLSPASPRGHPEPPAYAHGPPLPQNNADCAADEYSFSRQLATCSCPSISYSVFKELHPLDSIYIVEPQEEGASTYWRLSSEFQRQCIETSLDAAREECVCHR